MSARATRRAVMLGGAGSLALAAPAGVCASEARSSDAALIALAAEHAIAEAECMRLSDKADSFAWGSPVRTSLIARSDEFNERTVTILAEAGGLRTSTGEGLRAKASMLRSSLTYVDRGLDKVSDVEHQLAWSIVRDMLEMPA